MKRVALIVFAAVAVTFLCTAGWAEEKSVKASSEVTEVTIVSPATEAGEDLDLYAVAELFKEAEGVEEFEKALNDSANEINNLDLAGDGDVDYIHVVDNTEGNIHILVLQVALAEDDYQDIATIEIEKKSDEDVDLQVVGNEEIYGEDYVVEPDQYSTTVIHVHTCHTCSHMAGDPACVQSGLSSLALTLGLEALSRILEALAPCTGGDLQGEDGALDQARDLPPYQEAAHQEITCL